MPTILITPDWLRLIVNGRTMNVNEALVYADSVRAAAEFAETRRLELEGQWETVSAGRNRYRMRWLGVASLLRKTVVRRGVVFCPACDTRVRGACYVEVEPVLWRAVRLRRERKLVFCVGCVRPETVGAKILVRSGVLEFGGGTRR